MSHSEIRGVLPRSFYARPVLQVTRDVIGKVLVCELGKHTLAGRIVEAEAYRGPLDRAAHSFGGRRTARTEAMFGPPGHAYVFFVYGMHWHFNLVVNSPGKPEAVLIRAIEPLWGVELMAKRRQLKANSPLLSNGPGKLCQALGISERDYGHDLTVGRHLYLLDGPKVPIDRTTRIGIAYAGSWAAKPWRYFERNNRYVSQLPKNKRPKTPARNP
ncbi:MAG TPA: DNA-3-methyladenine glycosylase [Polyangiaceae bacterium]|nr:DNA-3-methyladenine glycosylase [Polyangiaceae bacterium]